MLKTEKYLLYALFIISIIFFTWIIFSISLVPLFFPILSDFIVVLFYILAIITPLYFGIKWLIKPTKKYFKILLLSSLPFIIFGIWFFITMKQLAEALENF